MVQSGCVEKVGLESKRVCSQTEQEFHKDTEAAIGPLTLSPEIGPFCPLESRTLDTYPDPQSFGCQGQT